MESQSLLPRTFARCHRYLKSVVVPGARGGARSMASVVRIACLAAMATIAVSGCAPHRPPGGGGGFTNCSSDMCRPAVRVSIIGNRCTVSVGIDPIRVPRGTVVTWSLAQIAADPILFLPNGIAIDDPAHDFVLPQLGSTGTSFMWTASDVSSSRLPLKYSVHAVWMKDGTDGILCRVLDPVIVNEF